MKLGNIDVYFHQQTNIVSVLLTKPTDDPTAISNYQNNAQNITELFVYHFKNEITNWGGNIEIFRDFQNLLFENCLDADYVAKNLCNSCISTESSQITHFTV